MLTSLNSLAATLPDGLLAGLVREKMWSPAVGLTTIRQIPEARQAASALVAIAPYLAGEPLQEALAIAEALTRPYDRGHALVGLAGQLTDAEARSRIMAEALATVPRGPFVALPEERCLALTEMAGYLTQEPLHEALAIARMTQDAYFRARTLLGFVSHLSIPEERSHVLAEALSSARQIGEAWDRARVLTQIATHPVNIADRSLMLTEALATAQTIDETDLRVPALTGIAQHLPETEQYRILAEFLTIDRTLDNDRDRIPALIVLAGQSTGERLQEILSIIRTMEREDDRVQALRGVASQLAEGEERSRLWAEAHATALTLTPMHARYQALVQLASALAAAGESDQALAVARTIEGVFYRARILPEIASGLTAATDRSQALAEALSDARKIGDGDSRAQLLAECAHSLAVAGKTDQALTTARTIESDTYRAEAFAAIAPYLTVEALQIALALARRLEDAPARGRALAGLAGYLPDAEQRSMVLAEIVSAVPSIERTRMGARPRTLAIVACADLLKESTDRSSIVERALATIRTIERDQFRSEALIALAPYLTGEALQEAFPMGQAITTMPFRPELHARFAPLLAATGKLEEALSMARGAGFDFYIAQALVGVAHYVQASKERTQIIAEALSHVRSIRNIFFRVQALTGMTSQLQDSEERSSMMAEALSLLQTITEPSYYVRALTGMVSQITEPEQRAQLLTVGLATAQRIETTYSRAKGYMELAAHLHTLPPKHFYPLWNTLMSACSVLSREDMQKILAQMSGALLEHGTVQTIEEIQSAVRDTARWWP